MLRAILSRRELSAAEDYYRTVADLLESREVRMLKEHRHHIGTSRFQHSVNVSYYNYLICRRLRLDAAAAARAGLLHDLFFYDRRTHERIVARHPAEHADIAFYNASMSFSINELEGDMILNHMWPVTPRLPRHAETYVLTVVDKFCASTELCVYFLGRIRRRLSKMSGGGSKSD